MSEASPATVLPSPSELIRRFSKGARKSFGQHFLSDPAILDRIIAHANLKPGDPVAEIGPGPGGLTVRLLNAGAKLRCLDADRRMVEHLSREFGALESFEVVLGDATGPALDELLGAEPPVVIGNLPYNVATPILFALLDRPNPPDRMVLMFQLEVARRVVDQGPGRDFGPMGLAANIRFETDLVMKIPPGAFFPPPKVDSGVVVLTRRPEPPCSPEVEAAARRVARAAFGQRRKMLRKSLQSLDVDVEALCVAAGVDSSARPEALNVPAMLSLGKALLQLAE